MCDLGQWRAAIGLHYLRRSASCGTLRNSPRNLCFESVAGMMCGIILLQSALLLCCGDIEENPGPTGGKTTRQSTLTGGGVSSSPVPPPAPPSPVSEASLSKMQDTILLTIRQERTVINENMNRNFEELRGEIATLSGVIDNLKSSVSDLQDENKNLTEKLNAQDMTISLLTNQIDRLENHSRRNNLIFFGIKKDDPKETWDDCEMKVTELLKESGMFNDDSIAIERAHRLGSRGDTPPLIVKFASFKTKDQVLQARRALKERHGISVGEDFSHSMREKRKILFRYADDMRSKGKNVKVVYDHVVLDGKKVFLSDISNSHPVPPPQEDPRSSPKDRTNRSGATTVANQATPRSSWGQRQSSSSSPTYSQVTRPHHKK